MADDPSSTPSTPGPGISVVIPNWNGVDLIPSCLDSLRRQTFRDFEAVVVDDGSTDGSVDLIRRDYPEVRLFTMKANSGFAAAANAGIAEARGDLVALLNNDAEADGRWLEELQRASLASPEFDFFASKILLHERRDIIHSAGDYYTLGGVPGNRGVWEKDDGWFDQAEEVFGACAAAAAYRRQLLEAMSWRGKTFDEALFMYCEDVDFNLRARLRGFRCFYVPTARVYHRLSATGGGTLASYYCGRNFLSVALADLPGGVLRRRWPNILAAQLSFAWQSLRHCSEAAARARLRGQLAAVFRLGLTLAKRKMIQRQRTISDHEFERLLSP